MTNRHVCWLCVSRQKPMAKRRTKEKLFGFSLSHQSRHGKIQPMAAVVFQFLFSIIIINETFENDWNFIFLSLFFSNSFTFWAPCWWSDFSFSFSPFSLWFRLRSRSYSNSRGRPLGSWNIFFFPFEKKKFVRNLSSTVVLFWPRELSFALKTLILFLQYITKQQIFPAVCG